MRLIKKYVNHKHYDAGTGAYVSMTEIGRIAASGEEVRVVCDRTGRDVTLEALARSLYDHLREKSSVLGPPPPRAFPVGELVRLLRIVAAPAGGGQVRRGRRKGRG